MRRGEVAPELAAELPGLGIAWREADLSPGPSPEPVRRRLRLLSDRFRGAHAVALRELPVPVAYRAFFRQVGLDPDRTRIPVEDLAVERLQHGGFRSRGLPADALTIATIETGVAICAFDAARLRGGLAIRPVGEGEAAPGLLAGSLAVADEAGPVAPLFGEPGAAHAVAPGTSRAALVAIQVPGVAEMAIEEALWLAAEALAPPP